MLYPPEIHFPMRGTKVVINETIKIENTRVSTIYDELQKLISKDDYADAIIEIWESNENDSHYYLQIYKSVPESDEDYDKKLATYKDACAKREKKIKETELAWLEKLAAKHNYRIEKYDKI